MSKALNPSTTVVIAEEKIGRFLDMLWPELRELKHAITDAQFQEFFVEGEKLYRIKRRFATLLQEILAEAANTLVVVAEVVNYDLSPTEAIRASGCVEYLTDSVVATMPRLFTGIQYNVPAVLFRTGKWRSVEEFEQDFEQRGLVPDLYLQAAINAENRELADKYPNVTQWDRDGKVASFLAFDRGFDGERRVGCRRVDSGWGGIWFGVGRRKETLDSRS